MKTVTVNNYSVNMNIDKEDVIKRLVDEWVMRWAKKQHPDIFKTAEKEIRQRLETDI